jgi:gliding motility-associated-like protein
MNKLYAVLVSCFTALVLMISVNTSFGNNGAAAELSYTWLRDSTYKVVYTFYRDCGGNSEASSINVCYYNTCNPDRGDVKLAKQNPLSSNGTVVGVFCDGTESTTCSSPSATIKGFRKWIYEGTVTLPSKCDSWKFAVSIEDRNNGITNYLIPGTGTKTLYTEAQINNLDAPIQSSPSFSSPLIIYACAGQTQTVDLSGIDPDGYSLSYDLINPAIAPENQTNCRYPAGSADLSFGGALPGTVLPGNPFPNAAFGFSTTTGLLTFTPSATLAQIAQLAVRVTKANLVGKVVATYTRDIQIIVSNTCNNVPTNFELDKTTSLNVLWEPGKDTVYLCPNLSMKVCFKISSSASDVKITKVTDDHLTFSKTPGSMGTYNGLNTNEVDNCFEWTPTESDEGVHIMNIVSEVCKPGTPLIKVKNQIVFDVRRTINIVSSDTFKCLGNPAELCAVPTPLNVVNWYTTTAGSGTKIDQSNIITPADPCTQVLPPTTTSYIVETTDIPGGCKRADKDWLETNQDEIKIVIVNPRIDAGPDTTMCNYSELILNGNLENPQRELSYKYHWTSIPENAAKDWLEDDSAISTILKFPSPDILPVSDIPDSIRFTFSIYPTPDDSPSCAKSDTVWVYIMKGFYITTGDTLQSITTGLGHLGRQNGVSDTGVCLGETITLQGFSDTSKPRPRRFTYTWAPPTGVASPNPDKLFEPGLTTITPTETRKYSLTASYAGCKDSTKDFYILVEESPTVDIGQDREICFGDTVNLNPSIEPNVDDYKHYKYKWTPGGAIDNADTFLTYFAGYKTERIKLTVTTLAGCEGSDSILITVNPRQFLTIGADTSICAGDSVQLEVSGDKLLHYVTWKPNNNIDSIQSLKPIVQPFYDTKYTVIGVDSNRCIDSAEVTVRIKPNAVLYLEDSVTIYPGDSYTFDPKSNCYYFSWFPAVGLDQSEIANPTASPLLSTTYYVTAKTADGCEVRDSVYLVVTDDSYIDVPNSFIPGNTGDNNKLKPINLGTAQLTSFKVFDRWGQLMFESSDFNEAWDGTLNGKFQPMGVYVYTLEAITAKGKKIIKSGNVTLLR